MVIATLLPPFYLLISYGRGICLRVREEELSIRVKSFGTCTTFRGRQIPRRIVAECFGARSGSQFSLHFYSYKRWPKLNASLMLDPSKFSTRRSCERKFFWDAVSKEIGPIHTAQRVSNTYLKNLPVLALVMCTVCMSQLAFAGFAPAVLAETGSQDVLNTSMPSVESILAKQLVHRFREMSDEELEDTLQQLLKASRSSGNVNVVHDGTDPSEDLWNQKRGEMAKTSPGRTNEKLTASKSEEREKTGKDLSNRSKFQQGNKADESINDVIPPPKPRAVTMQVDKENDERSVEGTDHKANKESGQVDEIIVNTISGDAKLSQEGESLTEKISLNASKAYKSLWFPSGGGSKGAIELSSEGGGSDEEATPEDPDLTQLLWEEWSQRVDGQDVQQAVANQTSGTSLNIANLWQNLRLSGMNLTTKVVEIVVYVFGRGETIGQLLVRCLLLVMAFYLGRLHASSMKVVSNITEAPPKDPDDLDDPLAHSVEMATENMGKGSASLSKSLEPSWEAGNGQVTELSKAVMPGFQRNNDETEGNYVTDALQGPSIKSDWQQNEKSPKNWVVKEELPYAEESESTARNMSRSSYESSIPSVGGRLTQELKYSWNGQRYENSVELRSSEGRGSGADDIIQSKLERGKGQQSDECGADLMSALYLPSMSSAGIKISTNESVPTGNQFPPGGPMQGGVVGMGETLARSTMSTSDKSLDGSFSNVAAALTEENYTVTDLGCNCSGESMIPKGVYLGVNKEINSVMKPSKGEQISAGSLVKVKGSPDQTTASIVSSDISSSELKDASTHHDQQRQTTEGILLDTGESSLPNNLNASNKSGISFLIGRLVQEGDHSKASRVRNTGEPAIRETVDVNKVISSELELLKCQESDQEAQSSKSSPTAYFISPATGNSNLQVAHNQPEPEEIPARSIPNNYEKPSFPHAGDKLAEELNFSDASSYKTMREKTNVVDMVSSELECSKCQQSGNANEELKSSQDISSNILYNDLHIAGSPPHCGSQSRDSAFSNTEENILKDNLNTRFKPSLASVDSGLGQEVDLISNVLRYVKSGRKIPSNGTKSEKMISSDNEHLSIQQGGEETCYTLNSLINSSAKSFVIQGIHSSGMLAVGSSSNLQKIQQPGKLNAGSNNSESAVKQLDYNKSDRNRENKATTLQSTYPDNTFANINVDQRTSPGELLQTSKSSHNIHNCEEQIKTLRLHSARARKSEKTAVGMGSSKTDEFDQLEQSEMALNSFVHGGVLWIRDEDGVFLQQPQVSKQGMENSKVEGLSSPQDLPDSSLRAQRRSGNSINSELTFSLSPQKARIHPSGNMSSTADCKKARKRATYGFDYAKLLLETKGKAPYKNEHEQRSPVMERWMPSAGPADDKHRMQQPLTYDDKHRMQQPLTYGNEKENASL